MPHHYRKLSFWHDSVPDSLEPRPALRGEKKADIAIVGAGYTGLWTAWHLKRLEPSLDIVVLEAEIAGFGASGRNGGWCSAYLSGIGHWLDQPATRESAIRLQRQMFETVHEIGAFAEQHEIDCHFESAGALEIAVIPAQLQRLEKEMEYLRALGFDDGDYRWLDSRQCRENLNVEHAQGAIHLHHCAAIHPARLARGLADAVEEQGVTIHELSPVVNVDAQSVHTAEGRVTAETILMATEGYGGGGSGGRLIPVHSMMVATEPLSGDQLEYVNSRKRFCFGNLDHLVTYGQLTADNRIAFGCRGGYHFGATVRSFDPSLQAFETVRETLLTFFPGLKGIAFTHAWGGAMGVARTVRPSVNFDRNRGRGWAGGYFGNGVGASHLAGKTLADLALGRDTKRTATPWVNPPDADRRWEPEPFRWLGIQSRAQLMRLADRAEYRDSRSAGAYRKILETLYP